MSAHQWRRCWRAHTSGNAGAPSSSRERVFISSEGQRHKEGTHAGGPDNGGRCGNSDPVITGAPTVGVSASGCCCCRCIELSKHFFVPR